MLNMKIDQMAFIAHNDIDVWRIKRNLGLSEAEWVEDYCVASGEVRGVEGTNKARLLFNYANGIEIEILQYLEGPNYAESVPGGHLCHVGMHYSGEGDVPTFDVHILQRVETQSHTNPFLVKNGRRYRYTIYDTTPIHGVPFKVIERIA